MTKYNWERIFQTFNITMIILILLYYLARGIYYYFTIDHAGTIPFLS